MSFREIQNCPVHSAEFFLYTNPLFRTSIDESLDKSISEIKECTEKIVCNVIEELHCRKRQAHTEIIEKNVAKYEISSEETKKTLDSLLKSNVLETTTTKNKESIRFNRNRNIDEDQVINVDIVERHIVSEKLEDDRFKVLSDKVKYINEKVSSLENIPSIVETLEKENMFLKDEIKELTGLLDVFAKVIERQTQSTVSEQKISDNATQINSKASTPSASIVSSDHVINEQAKIINDPINASEDFVQLQTYAKICE